MSHSPVIVIGSGSAGLTAACLAFTVATWWGVFIGIIFWLGSVAVGRPVAGVFAREVFPVDDQTRASAEYHAVFRYVSLLFGIFFLAMAAVQLAVLLIVGIGAFIATRVLDAVGILAMAAYCVRYIGHRFGAQMNLALTTASPVK